MTESGKQEVWPGGIPQPLMPYAPAVKAGNWVFVAGQVATDFKAGLAEEARVNPAFPFNSHPLTLQSRYILKNLGETLKAAGASWDDVVRIYQWFVAPDSWEQGTEWSGVNITRYLEERDKFITSKRPASTGMGVRELLIKDAILEVNMIAIIPEKGEVKEAISAPDIPKPLAGYSEAIKMGDWVFYSGELSTDWVGDWGRAEHYGEPSGIAVEARTNPYFWYGIDIRQQTDYQLKVLQSIAEAAGSSLENTVKATVYLPDPNDFVGFEEVWKSWFPKDPPARTIIPYSGLGIRGSILEIALKTLTNDAKIKKETIETSKAPKPLTHEPQAVKAGNYLFLSGQMACNETGLAKEAQRNPGFPYYGSPNKMQMEYILKNTAAICEAAGTSLDNVVSRQCFHTSFEHFHDSIMVWADHFPPGKRAASTTIKIGGPLLVPGCEILLDMIAYIPPK